MANSSILLDNDEKTEVPAAVRLAQQQGFLSMEKQPVVPVAKLFFSFDIVNSTVYKANTVNWPIIIKGLLDYIRRCVQREADLQGASLWRVIGDEMVFVYQIIDKRELYPAVDAIFRITQRVSLSIRTGKFFNTLEEQKLQKAEIEVLKSQEILSIKAAAWIAAISKEMKSPYDNIQTEYESDGSNIPIVEYLGRDIDTGFRLKAYTQRRRLIVSFELACLIAEFLEKEAENLFYIIDYAKLKGVWNRALYPIIWYYKKETLKEANELSGTDEEILDFKDSFYYDEADGNELVERYIARQRRKDNQEIIASQMYKVRTMCKKICVDRNLKRKIEYLKNIMGGNVQIKNGDDRPAPLKLHCAVVCCDIENKKILICKRGNAKEENCGKWEFGCAKARGSQHLADTIKEYYSEKFGVDIELVLDESRDEKQPIPLAIYEVPIDAGATKKGIIFVAKVKNPQAIAQYRQNDEHSSIKWVKQEELEKIAEENAVTDFHNTANIVFEKWNDLFGKDD